MAASFALCLALPFHQAAHWAGGSDRRAGLWPHTSRISFPGQKTVVEWMGDTRLRRVGRDLITAQQMQQMARSLQPGDILLARKNWYLSNIGLPGFWTHAAIYIGPPHDLEAFSTGLTSDLRSRFPDAWTRYVQGPQGQSRCVIEALSEGILLRTLQQCRGDYLAVLRPRLSPATRARAIAQAFAHLGKPYDFDFDFTSDDALVCTELVWRCYRPAPGREGLHFDLVEIAGRQTLPANDIAQLYATQRHLPGRQLEFVYFLDASEKRQTSFVSDEPSFSQSHKRSRWDFTLQ